MTTCRETTELASRAMDERLPFSDRVAMRMHLAICRNCAHFNRQLQQMRRLFCSETDDASEGTSLAPEARERIEAELRKKLDA